MRLWIVLASASASVVALATFSQARLCTSETRAQGRRADALRKAIRALEVTEQKAEEFTRERQLLAEKLDTLRRITPRESAVEELIARLGAVASEFRLTVPHWSDGSGPAGDLLRQQWVRLVLEGDLRRLPELMERCHKLARLVTWLGASVHASRADARLWIYYAPDTKPVRLPDLCLHPPSNVWLWPYTAKVKTGRAEIDVLCAQQARHAETMAQVDDFEAKKSRLEELVAAIEKVRAERKLPEIQVDPVPGGRPADGVPGKSA